MEGAFLDRTSVRATANFSTKSAFLNWYLGGLNFQIEHHLFPHICHVHYLPLSKIVKKTLEEFNMEYIEFDTIFAAVNSHYKTLKEYSVDPAMATVSTQRARARA